MEPTESHELRDGFRERGQQVTRIEAFVDAAFAFAVTLLVISFDGLPKSADELIAAYKGIPAFAASFLLLASFWRAHERWSRWYGLDDGRSTALSLLLVFLVLVYVYPLRLLFAGFFHFVTQGLLPADFVIRTASDLRWMFGSYAVAYGSLSLVIWSLYRHAYRQRARLRLDVEEAVRTRLIMLQWRLAFLVAMLSLALSGLIGSVLDQDWTVALPGMIYFLMFLMIPLSIRYERKYRDEETRSR